MGELHLPIHFSYSFFMNMMLTYTHPFLPRMHYIHPLLVTQLEMPNDVDSGNADKMS